MTDAQLIGLVIAMAVTPLATLVVVLFSRTAEQRPIKSEVAVVTKQIELSEFRMHSRIEKMESSLLSRMADIETRLQHI